MNLPASFKQIFEPGLLQEITEKAKFISVKENDVILEIGQAVRVIPLLVKGVLKISRAGADGNELLLYYVHANESCAMTFTCCMQQVPSEIRATAETDVEYLAVPVNIMEDWFTKYPTWKSFVMRTIRFRFNELLNAIDDLAFHKLDARLIKNLREKSKASASAVINISHEQLAAELATSREVVSRLLKKLEQDGKLLLYRNQIKLLREL